MVRVSHDVDAGDIERRRLVARRLQVEAEIACGDRGKPSTKTSATRQIDDQVVVEERRADDRDIATAAE